MSVVVYLFLLLFTCLCCCLFVYVVVYLFMLLFTCLCCCLFVYVVVYLFMLLFVCLHRDHRLGRLGATHIVSHPFFKNAKWTWDNIRECELLERQFRA